jgi:NAD(P)-dependent dehydrogenase (short-subunit alcohol dehydrogenase family)
MKGVPMDLSGKIALVTGGAQRAGRYICLALARAGADIVMNYWRTEEDARNTRAEIESLGRRCLPIEADVSDIRQVQLLIEQVEKSFGSLDILIHNASNFNRSPFLEVTEEIWESSFGVNLKGPFFLSQAAAKLMLKKGSGRIIALVGNSYYENWPDFIPHAIAKTALAKMIQSLAIALSPHIQCNAICPASFLTAEGGQTEAISSRREQKYEERFLVTQGVKLHRGTPEEVAEFVVYLSGCSNYLNGAVIPIDGGKYAI